MFCISFTYVTFIISFFKDQSEKWLVSTSYGLIIEISRIEKLQKYRIILSQHISYLHKLLVSFLICLLLLCLLFFFWDWHFMEVGYHAYPAGWGWRMQAGSVPCDQKFSYKWNFSFFKAVPSNVGSLPHIISFLFSHFRSRDSIEHFGIYSQLDRKSKTWFFILLNVYVSWTE